ncbi:hypothetical protein [Yimella sp. cx-51]|uniref:hypothetical protein n=1 Tax=Yimella sp. cx-51 TaxID=2770551 RepID=UPI00165E48E4|nr:hypothetical protein [Yimella sp. cx-51]MBC9956350.1 hypothetical protein [Yimella sp. cx-51]
MTSPVILIAARRSLGKLFALLVLLVEAVALFTHGTTWTTVWALSASHVAGGTIIVGPVVAAAGAAAFVERSRREGLVPEHALSRDTLVRFSVLLCWMFAAHLAAVVVAYVLTAVVHGGVGPYDLRLISLSFVVLTCYCALGALAGTLFPSWPTVPITAIGCYLLAAFTSIPPTKVIVGGAQGVGGMLGQEYRADGLAVQALWFISIAVVLSALLLSARSRLARCVALLAALGVAVAATLTMPGDTLRPRANVALVCRDRVCVDKEVAEEVAPVEKAVRPLLLESDRLASSVGGAESVRQVVAVYPFRTTPGQVAIGWAEEPPHVDPQATAWSLIQAISGCSERQAGERPAPMQTASSWLLHAAGIDSTVIGPGGPVPSPTQAEGKQALGRLVADCR